jgi:eukaryotic-like serine/threonine-protein kinase
MPSKITLSVTRGNLKGQHYLFEERTTCIIGRAEGCLPQLPDDPDHSTISRYHCLLDINPPNIRVRDFGSKNGTYVNGKKIGQRLPEQTPEEGAKMNFPEYDLQAGDTIKLSSTEFQVAIEFATEDRPTINVAKANVVYADVPKKPNFLELLNNLLKRAIAGDRNLVAIRGYEIVKLLGKGGFGEVYLARNEQTQEIVALKVMLPEIVAHQSAIDQFFREAQNTKMLSHTHIVELRDLGYSDGVFFLTMEYCDRGSVKDLMESQGGRLSIDKALEIIFQVLEALDYAHHAEIPYVKLADGGVAKGRGLVHRDLKPANIFLTKSGKKTIAKVGDYGLAKAFDLAGLSGQTLTGSKAGTPAFMPRQQVLNFKYAQPEVDDARHRLVLMF